MLVKFASIHITKFCMMMQGRPYIQYKLLWDIKATMKFYTSRMQ